MHKAAEKIITERVYVMNVDDIILSDTYSPLKLMHTLNRKKQDFFASIFTSWERFPYSVVNSRDTGLVVLNRNHC